MSPGLNATPTKQNIFSMRLQSARANLDALNSSVETIKSRNLSLSELQGRLADKPSAIAKTVDELREHVERTERYAEKEFDKSSIINAAREALESLNKLDILLKVAKEKINKITVLKLSRDLFDPRNIEFGLKVRDGAIALDDITDAAERDDKQWNALKQQGSKWAEYLDYLAGLSLRHDGLDAGVCDIADRLIVELQQLSQADLAALAIPGRDGCNGLQPKIVYLRFPEWTVWALPLAAHELWHIVEDNKTPNIGLYGQFQKEAGKRGIKPVEEPKKIYLRECLADVFATYTMGPAYAVSSMVLALDPADQYRTQCIFRTLDHLNKKIEHHGVLNEVIFQLTDMWKEATSEAKVRPETLPTEFEGWTDALLVSLDKSRLSFPTQFWIPSVQPMINNLKNFNIPVEDIDIHGTTLRLGLSAAWQARLDLPPEMFEEISKRCKTLCMRIGTPFQSPRDTSEMHNYA